MKWVGIDGNEANVLNRVGSNVYAFELLTALATWVKKTRRFHVRVYLSGDALPDMPPHNDWWQYRVIPNAPLWSQWRLPIALYQDRKSLSVFFSPGHYSPSSAPVPVVPSIMDLGYEYYPEQFRSSDLWQLKLLTRLSVFRAKHILAISEATKRDIVETYGRDSQDITVVYPAMPTELRLGAGDVAKIQRKFAINRPYVLYVGTIQPRKNLVRLIGAFEHVKKSHPDVQLVIAGRVGWLADEILARREASPFVNEIHLLGYVSDQEKQALIRGARVLALVGLYEGFGIPPLEAITHGVAPVVSDTSSLPEVVGPDGVTVSAEDELAIASGLQTVMNWSKEEYQERVAKMQSYCQRFSWQSSAEKLGELLAKMV